MQKSKRFFASIIILRAQSDITLSDKLHNKEIMQTSKPAKFRNLFFWSL